MDDCTLVLTADNGAKVCADAIADMITETDAKPLWLIVCGGLVFLMHLGFSMLEAGCVSKRNVQNILLKNIMNACIGTLVWFCIGYGVAYGGNDDNEFIGMASYWGGWDDSANIDWFFQWAFCVTASTIVSGAVAERMKLAAFFIACVVITGFIYPIVVHWVWDGEGWLSAGKKDRPFIDFAGSGVVHMVGGFCALMGAAITGERPGRFNAEKPIAYGNHSVPFQLFGTIILWVGWYGFNCGSTLAVQGAMPVAARVAVTTTLSAATGGLVTTFWAKIVKKKWSIGMCCNGILAGLVSITAPCPVVEPGLAIVIGAIGGSLYFLCSNLMLILKIDDPLDAASVHGFCGMWGVLAAGIFSSNKYIREAYGDDLADMGWGSRFWNQIVGCITIFFWTVGTSGAMFMALKFTVGLRTEEGGEKGGLDANEFGMPAYSSTPRHSPEKKGVEGFKMELATIDKEAPRQNGL